MLLKGLETEVCVWGGGGTHRKKAAVPHSLSMMTFAGYEIKELIPCDQIAASVHKCE